MTLDKLVNEALSSEDCFQCSRKCCVYLFAELGPKLQLNEIPAVTNAVLNAQERIVNERAKQKFGLLLHTIMSEGIIPPLSVVINGLPEPVCGVYSLEKGKCLIYGDRPDTCRRYPVYVDENNIVWIDKACPQYEKTRNYLKTHGIYARLNDFLRTNLRIKRRI
jgi:Fe-S-cluster containining protein